MPTSLVKERIVTPDAATIEKMVIGDGNLDDLAASMCACNASSDNPY